MLDGEGKVIWEAPGHHFESVDVGRVLPNSPEPQLVVDIDHLPDSGPIWVFDGQGAAVGRLRTNYARHHCILDWNGDGLEEIIVGDSCGISDHRGCPILTLQIPTAGFHEKGPHERFLVPANVAGAGRPDLIVTSPNTAHIFRNEQGARDPCFAELGSERNFTLY